MSQTLRGCFVAFVFGAAAVAAQPQPEHYTATHSLDQMSGKQAVLETDAGTIVIQLLPEVAPTHVSHFMTLAEEGAYDGTTFHRAIRHGIIQGGDPISVDPAKRDQYGTGGLNRLKAEFSTEKHTRGAVSAVLVPNRPDSAGAQFFICVTDQPALDGQYTVFGRVAEGITVVQKISEAPVDEQGRIVERIEIRSVSIRDTPPPVPPAFSTESVEELAAHRAVLETSEGAITLGFMPEKAPEHVRQFLRLADAGVYDGTTFHRVVKGFVIQTGSLDTRSAPLDEPQQALVHPLTAEFNDTPHDTGIVSMAHGDDPDSATTSFFIVTAASPALDRQYTAFARVVDGLDVVERIESVEVDGETPVRPIILNTVRVVRP